MSVYSRCQKSKCKEKDNCKHRRWYYDFCVRGVRYQGSIPEARTKWEAEAAEVKVRRDIFERKYEISTAVAPFACQVLIVLAAFIHEQVTLRFPTILLISMVF